MSLKYKFDKFNENKGDDQEGNPVNDIEKFDTPSQIRSLSFVDVSGNHYFLNYAYLVTGEYKPAENAITLFFTSHSVVIKGFNLEGLFNELLSNNIKKVICVDKRYASTKSETETLVTEITVTAA